MGAEQPTHPEVPGYRIEGVIGRGGMSVVYVAQHARLKRKVALKVIAPDLAEDQRFRSRFLKESELAASLDHPNIIPIYDAGETDGLLYIAMRYVEGTDLKTLIGAEGPLPTIRVLSILSQVANGLDTAHARGLVHRDVKPAKILVASPTAPSGEEHVYLSDFGLTKRITSASGITGTGQFIGTLDYAAPEQFEGKPLDGRTDVYSLGCVFYECLAGEVPYSRDKEAAVMYAHLLAPPPAISAKRDGLPRDIDTVIARAMAKAPRDRYASSGDLMAAATACFESTPQGAGVRGRRTSGQKVRERAPVAFGRRRDKRLAILVVSLTALFVTVGAFLLASRGQSPIGTAPPTAADRLARVDPGTNRVVTFAGGVQPSAVAVGDGSVWVTTVEDRTLSRINARTGRLEVRIKVGELPTALAFGDGGDGRQDIWVANKLDGSVSRVDARANRVVATIQVGQGINILGVGAGGVWVAKTSSNSVSHIDPARNEVVETVQAGPAGEIVGGLGIADGAVWISTSRVTHPPGIGPSGYLTAQVTQIDPTSHKVVKTIRLFQATGGVTLGGISPLTVTPGGLWVANSSTDMVYRINPTSGRIESKLPINAHPVGIADDGQGSLWIATSFQRTLWRISTLSKQVSRTIELPGTPTGLAFGGGSIWLSMYGVQAGQESPHASP